MDSYNPEFTITSTMLSLVSSISENIGKLNEKGNLKRNLHLRKNNKIKSVHSSLKIEANSLSFSDAKDIIDGKLVVGDRKEIQEVKNAYDAYSTLGSFDPFSISDLLKMHKVMTSLLINDAGSFRKGEEGVFDGDKCIFMSPPAKFVRDEIGNLFQWINVNRNSIHPLILSSIFHYEFVFIHPFSDGNGRIARLWQTALLMEWKPIFEFIPLESQIEKFQDDYYNAISKSHIEGSCNSFVEFMLLKINEITMDALEQTKDNNAIGNKYVDDLLNVMTDRSYSSNEILSLLNLKSKENLRKNYINPAISLGLIEMTLPDKPNSKNQRYIKK